MRRPSSGAWKNWRTCWPFFTPGRSRRFAASPEPALAYLDKVSAQLLEAGLLTREDRQTLARERQAWEGRCQDFSDFQVLIHGDATPTNFLFPDGRAVALDLERLRAGDRLWDLSWVAGELKHAWGWRTADFSGSEGAIQHFFQAYLAASNLDSGLTRRVYEPQPFLHGPGGAEDRPEPLSHP